MPFTAQDVLAELDDCVNREYCFFMDLEHGYFHTANSRLSLFADSERWAIVFEKSGFANRGGRIELELNYFGNCLENLDGAGLDDQFECNAKWIDLVSGDALEEVELEAYGERVSPEATQVRLRDGYVPIPSPRAEPRKWLPYINMADSEDPDVVTFEDLGRFLAYEYEETCRATPDELRMCLPADLPLLLGIDAWHHRRYDGYADEPLGDPPSSYETFRLIADVLATRDPNRFRPTLEPTNHWRNWPEAGGL